MKGDDIYRRLRVLGNKVLNLLDRLQDGAGAHHVKAQLARCGTAGGALYQEARGAESGRDFVHKLGVTLKEVKETFHWLTVIQERNMAGSCPVDDLIRESDELARILFCSIRTARRSLVMKRPSTGTDLPG